MCRQRDHDGKPSGSRDDACAFYEQVDGMARLWRARDIVPFV